MPFTRVGDLLAKRRNLYGPEKRIFDAMAVLSAWSSVLESINCSDKFQRTRAVAYRNKILTIQAASAAVVSELRMCEDKIKQAYEKRFKTTVIDRLVIKR